MAVPVVAAQAATFVVDRADDADVSACSSAANDCSLRGAINKANAQAGADTITFAANVRGTITLAGTQLPVVTDELAIQGSGASTLALDGAGNFGILETDIAVPIQVSGLTLRNGKANIFSGGAVYSRGNATITNCVFSNNRGESGGAIYNNGATTIANCTFNSNIVTGFGGAIYSIASSNDTSVAVRNCTFNANSANYGGAISNSSGPMTIESCTLNANTANGINGGGVNAGDITTIRNSIVVGNQSRDVATTEVTNYLRSGGYNLIGDNTNISSSTFNAPGDRIGVADAFLGALQNNGGATPTQALLQNSPAIDAGNTSLTTDQRGAARPAGSAPDIGAFEMQTNEGTPETPSLIVTTGTDVVANDGQTSLREAINYANSKAGADTISFAANVRGTLTIGDQLPIISDALTLQGPGARGLSVDGGGATRLLQIGAGVTATIADVTLANGRFSPNDGRGGGFLNEGNLTLSQVFMTGNVGIEGGGFANLNGSVTLVGCLLSGNTAFNAGGGFLNNNGSVTLINSTVSNNVANGSGNSGAGGISTFGAQASVRLDSATLSGNSAPNVAGNTRAGIWQESGALTLHNSILYGNGARDLQVDAGTLASSGYNIIGQTSTTVGLAGSDRLNLDPKLGALANNGGPTDTQALQAGSPAINSGDPQITAGFDQRGAGFARLRGNAADVGAFELQDDAATPMVTLAPQKPRTDDTLTATAAGYGENPTLVHVWKKNGEVIPGETTATLDLSQPGNGDIGDLIAVEVSANGQTASASVVVVQNNSAPFAYSFNTSAPAATLVAIELRGADSEGDALTFEIVGAPSNGTAEIRVDESDGKLKLFYQSRARFNGVEVIRFRALDTSGAASNVATLGIAVKFSAPPVNRAPVAGDTFIDTFVGTSVVKGLLGRDPDGDPITFRIVNNARYGTSEIRRDSDGQFKLFYTSLNRLYGPDRVTYIAIDDKGKESNVATIGINFINRAPIAQLNDLQAASGQEVSQYLFAFDPDNDAVTFRLVNNPRFGTGDVRRDEQGNWRVFYQSVPGYVGPDRITFIAIDPQGKESQVATAVIRVVTVTSAPSALRAGTAPATAPSGGDS